MRFQSDSNQRLCWRFRICPCLQSSWHSLFKSICLTTSSASSAAEARDDLTKQAKDQAFAVLVGEVALSLGLLRLN